jgi:propionyl-CoA carboxylase alpha chain
MSIPIYYDPMIAKLVVHGKTRTEAIAKMLEAIKEYKIEGVATTLPFGTFVFEHEAFFSGQFDTHFVKNYYTPELIRDKQKANGELAAILAARYWMEEQESLRPVENKSTSWKRRLAH